MLFSFTIILWVITWASLRLIDLKKGEKWKCWHSIRSIRIWHEKYQLWITGIKPRLGTIKKVDTYKLYSLADPRYDWGEKYFLVFWELKQEWSGKNCGNKVGLWKRNRCFSPHSMTIHLERVMLDWKCWEVGRNYHKRRSDGCVIMSLDLLCYWHRCFF